MASNTKPLAQVKQDGTCILELNHALSTSATATAAISRQCLYCLGTLLSKSEVELLSMGSRVVNQGHSYDEV